MIDSLFLDEENFKYYNSISENSKLDKFSKLNIFIGSNNSGKSRFMRTFFSKPSAIMFSLSEYSLIELNDLIHGLKHEIEEYLNDTLYGDFARIKAKLAELTDVQYITIQYNIAEGLLNFIDGMKVFFKNRQLQFQIQIAQYQFEKDLDRIFDKYSQSIKERFKDLKHIKLNNIYIPTLRGLRRINSSNNDLYLEATKKDYFNSESEIENKIYTGASLYDDLQTLLLGTKKDRDKVKQFEEFLSENFFDNKDINIVPRIKKEVVYVRIDHEDHPIYDLGDGIQSIIILTYPLFFNQDKNLQVFIDEPEHYLHPGFQRIFIETLLNPKFEKLQYFITTHSNHFLDITLDVDKVSVYTFKKQSAENEEPKFVIENVENEDSNILDIIGVRNSSVFLSNCTIWVEGITDRIYLRKYLDIIQQDLEKHFKEDIHYSFVEYGGGNITHWSFLKNSDGKHPNIEVERLCGKLFLISDKDGAGLNKSGAVSKKAERHAELESTLGDRYYCLQCREMENALSPGILKKVIEEYEGENESKLVFSKKFNVADHYKDLYIGNYIEKNVLNLTRKYADKSGTINDKVNFAKKAVSHIKTEADMSNEAIKLTKRLLEFIKGNNR